MEPLLNGKRMNKYFQEKWILKNIHTYINKNNAKVYTNT